MSYVTFDEYGVKEIRCMVCNAVVAKRDYVEMDDKHKKKVKVMAMKRLPSWRQVRLNLDKGGYMEPIVCDKCEKATLDHDKIVEQVKEASAAEMENAGKTKKEMQAAVVYYEKLKVAPDEKIVAAEDTLPSVDDEGKAKKDLGT